MSEPRRENELLELVAQWVAAGVPVPEVERRLSERGVGHEEASKIVDSILAKQVTDAAKAQRRRNLWPLLFGIGLCVGGIAAVIMALIWWETDRSWQVLLVGIVAAGWGIREIIQAAY